MRKILITNDIRRLAKEYADNLFADKRKDFIKPKKGLRDFADELRTHDNNDYADYVDAIINNYNEILCLEPIILHVTGQSILAFLVMRI